MSETSEKYKTSYYLNKKDDRATIVFIHWCRSNKRNLGSTN